MTTTLLRPPFFLIAASMIATILSYAAMQQAIDYLVTSCLRLKRRKQQVQRARAALNNAPKACVVNAVEDVAERKMLEVKRKTHKRVRVRARAVPQAAIVNNASNL